MLVNPDVRSLQNCLGSQFRDGLCFTNVEAVGFCAKVSRRKESWGSNTSKLQEMEFNISGGNVDDTAKA